MVAQRVADIITRTGQVHTYVPLKGNRRDGYWPPEAVTENTGTKKPPMAASVTGTEKPLCSVSG